jgi:chromosome segregation ATPase
LLILSEYLEQGKEKRDRVAGALRMYDVQIRAHEDEITRLRDRNDRLKRQKERLMAQVVSIIQSLGQKKLEGKFSTLAVVNNPPSVEIRDPDAVPAEFKEIRQTIHIEKSEIATALKRGVDVPGANWKPNSVRLDVR